METHRVGVRMGARQEGRVDHEDMLKAE
jgi:hypothetical protein